MSKHRLFFFVQLVLIVIGLIVGLSLTIILTNILSAIIDAIFEKEIFEKIRISQIFICCLP